ncbi:MAG: glycosyltransferase family 4 protein [Prevotellaceae bacterium]|jgi:glycosyltransferase involved in cell wall biosynthesis|nr:glycosyltransferase family 4 protein [Prevotellaceae bacterium]
MNNNRYVCCIGRPSYQKNTFFLVDVVEKVISSIPDFKFHLLGVGFYSPEKDILLDKIEKKSLQNHIHLIPWLSHPETLKYLQNSLFYVNTALYEGLPLSVIEAMSLGKAVVVSKVAGNIDCVANGENGFVLELDSRLFAEKIVELYRNEDLRTRFGKRSRAMFEQNFLITKRIAELENIYREK